MLPTDSGSRERELRVRLIVAIVSLETPRMAPSSLGLERDAPCRRPVRQGGQ
jgi:hypothetical protein